MDYLLDTNLIIIYSRESRIAQKIEDDYNLVIEICTILASSTSLTQKNRYGKHHIITI